jgi:hypothetical protein
MVHFSRAEAGHSSRAPKPLPEEFIATMKTNAWQPPVELSDTGDGKLDSQFWLEWGVRHSKGKLL